MQILDFGFALQTPWSLHQPRAVRTMQKHVYDSCLECIRLMHGDGKESIVGDVARMTCLVRFAIFWHRRSLRQPLLSPRQLTLPPKLLRRGRFLRFLRAGARCVVATAH